MVRIECHSVHVLEQFVFLNESFLQHLKLRIDHPVLAQEAINLHGCVGQMVLLRLVVVGRKQLVFHHNFLAIGILKRRGALCNTILPTGQPVL